MADINKLPADTTNVKTKTGETVEVKINTTENAVTVDNDSTNPAHVRLNKRDFNGYDVVAVRTEGYTPLSVHFNNIKQPTYLVDSNTANEANINPNGSLDVNVVNLPSTQPITFLGNKQPTYLVDLDSTNSANINANGSLDVNVINSTQVVNFNNIKQPTYLVDSNTANEANINSDGTLDVKVSNFPSTQIVSFNGVGQPISNTSFGITGVTVADNALKVNGSSYTQNVKTTGADTVAVTGTFWQATQPVSIASMPTTPVTIDSTTNTVKITSSGGASNIPVVFPSSQPVTIDSTTNTVKVTSNTGAANIPVTVQNASIPVTGTFWQATQPVSGTVTANISGSISNTAFGIDQTTANANNVQLVRKNKKFARVSATTSANTAIELLPAPASGKRYRIFYINLASTSAPASGSIQFYSNTTDTYDSTTEFVRVLPNPSVYVDKYVDLGVDGFILDIDDKLYFRTTTAYTNALLITLHYIEE